MGVEQVEDVVEGVGTEEEAEAEAEAEVEAAAVAVGVGGGREGPRHADCSEAQWLTLDPNPQCKKQER